MRRPVTGRPLDMRPTHRPGGRAPRPGSPRPGVARHGARLGAGRLAAVLAAVVLAVLAGPVPGAQAHAFLARSNPADGQVLAAAPAQLRLDFSESVVLAATQIDVVDGSGRHITPTGLTLAAQGDQDAADADAGQDTEEPVEVVAALPKLGRGSYRISWETLSSDDLHRTSGVLVFGVGQMVTAGGLDEPAPPPLEAGLRWLVLLGLSGALGGALAGSLLRRGGEGDPHTSDAVRAASLARRGSVAGAVTAATAALVLLVTQLAFAGGRAVPLLWSSYGLRWGLREVGLLLLVRAALGRPGVPRLGARRLTLPGAALACLGTALLGHSGTSLDMSRLAASAAHVGAATTWSGCVVILAVVLAPRVRAGGAALESARVVLRRFGPPAAVCVAVMVVTGVYLSSEVVGSVDAALLTIYGRTLLLKVALAGVAGALALVNTLRLRRRQPRSTPRRTVLAEAVAAVGVLALAAVLTSGQPAMEPQLVRSTSRAPDGLVDRKVADLQETLSIRPNRPGANVVLVDVFDTRRPAPSPVRQVVVSLTSASGQEGPSLRAEPLPDGRWSVNTDLASTGAVKVHVTAMRRGLPDTTTTYGWTVGGAPSPTRPAVVSTAPVGPLLRLAAALLALALLGAGLLTPQLRDGARRAGARIVARRRRVSPGVDRTPLPDVEHRPESARR